MCNKKLGQEPAFTGAEGYGDFNRNGISKRLYIATTALQGLLSGNELSRTGKKTVPIIVQHAYKYADEMLKQELEETDE